MAKQDRKQLIERKYRRNYLTQVIARIDFAVVPSIAQSGPPASVTASLKKAFPYPEQKKVMFRGFTIKGDTTEQEAHESYQWFYYSENRDKTVHITGDCMYVEYKKYKSFGTLRRDFLSIVDALYQAVPELQVTRLGLRYVDTIDMPKEKEPTDWKKYIDPRLLSMFALATDRSKIARAFHMLVFNYGTYNMRFQYGMPNPDFPAPIRKKVFTLDYDAYCQSLLVREEIADYLDEFHTKIKLSFEEIITDGLRQKMGVIHG